MGGFPVVFVGYELENNYLEAYQSQANPTDPPPNRLNTMKALLRDAESETHTPISLVQYYNFDDATGYSSDEEITFICCFADLRDRGYSPRELDAVPVPVDFARVLGSDDGRAKYKTRGEIQRVFAPKAFMVYSYRENGESRVHGDAVIGSRL